MSKGLEAFEEIKTVMHKLFGGVERCESSLSIVEKELKRLEELEIMYSNCVIESTKQKQVLELIKSCITYKQALLDRTKNPDNDLICFEIKGLVNEETWLKIYEALKGPYD